MAAKLSNCGGSPRCDGSLGGAQPGIPGGILEGLGYQEHILGHCFYLQVDQGLMEDHC